jgi:LemA protein
MTRGTIFALVLLVLLLIFGVGGCSIYNRINTKDEAVNAQWHQVENQYQRRLDLIPNLVATVKQYADFEKSTLEAVVNARANATKVTIDPSKLDEQSMAQYQAAQNAVSQSLGRLLMVSENYPDLKANQSFRDLQAQLEGTENRIATERMRFNEMVQDYNTYIRTFPRNLFGRAPRAYFNADAGAEKAPNVNDLFNK